MVVEFLAILLFFMKQKFWNISGNRQKLAADFPSLKREVLQSVIENISELEGEVQLKDVSFNNYLINMLILMI